ncbi:MAG: MoaD family protein [Nitrososphaerota archaeon]
MAKIRVLVTAALSTYMNGDREIIIEAETVRDLIDKLITKYGKNLASRLLDENGKIRRFINIYVNDKNVRVDETELKLKDGDQILIMPAVSGGKF